MRQLLEINPKEFYDKILSEEEIFHWFELCDAVWLHDGNPEKPHAELISGMCSNGYFDCTRVLCYPNLCEILARQLVQKLVAETPLDMVDWVIGSAYAAITFSYEVAKALGVKHGFVEKDPAEKRMIWQRLAIPQGAIVLQIEELITTSLTVRKVRWAVITGNLKPVTFVPVVGTLVHRPPKLPIEYGELGTVISLIEKAIWAVNPEDCSLCQVGSPRYRPKTNWRELTGKK